MTTLRLTDIAKQYARIDALWQINLQINAGELFFLLGPSGCGKTTLLRIIAGLESPTRGQIYFNDEDVTALPTQQRNAVMCFQGYALWPHMTVAENIAFGIARPKAQRANFIAEILQWMKMQEYASAYPSQLSGGQQQRVALARALAAEPRCLLLDEPLSNLDAQLRLELRSEIRRICKQRGITTIYVTHDQSEALSVADRIAVMNLGHIEQVGTPTELYNQPANSFVAKFIANSNVIPGQLIAIRGSEAGVQTDVGTIMARIDESAPWRVGSTVMLSIRPETFRPADDDNSINRLTGQVVATTFLGDTSEHLLEIKGRRLRVHRNPPVFDPPEQMSVQVDPADIRLLAK
ncbi:MAG TPA: ABC transporter ATP-binding protein [Tepidisphaeraceae bacterium]|jgi:iron(III) transport system ATP-binding protein